jgi:hypothetical protein
MWHAPHNVLSFKSIELLSRNRKTKWRAESSFLKAREGEEVSRGRMGRKPDSEEDASQVRINFQPNWLIFLAAYVSCTKH